MEMISSITSEVVNKSLDGLARRHQAIASNVANAETPGYRRRDVAFEDALGTALNSARGQQDNTQASNSSPLAMRTANPYHIQMGNAQMPLRDVTPRDVVQEDYQFRNDKNGVDTESEMAKMAENTQRFLALSNMESRRIKSLKSVISGG